MKNNLSTIANAFPKKQFYSTVIYLLLIYNYSGIAVKAQQEKPIPPITYENVPYGDHPNQVIDFRKANVEKSAPLVVFIHGGGFTGGSHDNVNAKAVKQYLDAGIHHASLEYRFLKHADFPAAHEDCIRALQFIRSKAKEWGIDKNRIAGYGGSAGAQLVAYLAWGNDFADPKSDDPISRESSRLKAVAFWGGQSTMDLNWWTKNIPGYSLAVINNNTEIADLLRKHGGKTSEELKAEGK